MSVGKPEFGKKPERNRNGMKKKIFYGIRNGTGMEKFLFCGIRNGTGTQIGVPFETLETASELIQ